MSKPRICHYNRLHPTTSLSSCCHVRLLHLAVSCSEPANKYPETFSASGLFGKFPFALPTIIAAFLSLAGKPCPATQQRPFFSFFLLFFTLFYFFFPYFFYCFFPLFSQASTKLHVGMLLTALTVFHNFVCGCA